MNAQDFESLHFLYTDLSAKKYEYLLATRRLKEKIEEVENRAPAFDGFFSVMAAVKNAQVSVVTEEDMEKKRKEDEATRARIVAEYRAKHN